MRLFKWLLCNRRLVATITTFLISIIFIFVTCYFAFPELIGRLGYEADQPYTADNALYFAVGKGMIDGLIPYQDLYENKPPMIFILSAISWAMTGDFYFVTICCIISFLVIIFIPIFYIFYKGYKRGLSPTFSVIVCAMLIGPIMLLAFYAHKRSGESQVEIFGAASSIICLLFLYLTKEKTNIKFYHPYLILAGLFLAVSLLFKEPFAAILIVLMLFFVNDKRTFLYLFLLPLAYSLIFAFITLLSCRCLVPYFTIYIANMFSNHINAYGDPIERTYRIGMLFNDLYNFSLCLPLLIVVLFAFDIFFISMNFSKEDTKGKFLIMKDILLLIAAFFCASLMVALGGQYYNHHYVFALPYYIFLILLYIEKFPVYVYKAAGERVKFKEMFTKKHETSATISISLIIALLFTSFSSFSISKNDTNYRYEDTIENTSIMREDAAYIDKVLDALDEERYLYIGFNGFRPYAYTKHNPIGPIFVQDSNNFQDENSFFVTSFINQLNEANVIVYNRNYTNVIAQYTTSYIYENFTLEEPSAVNEIEKTSRFKANLPISSNEYLIYYRENAF